MTVSRRGFLAGSTALALAGASRVAAGGARFRGEDVIGMARALAEAPYAPRPAVPPDWQNLTYEQYRSIWFRATEALWAGTDSPFAVDFFPPGLYFKRPVAVAEVKDGDASAVPFDMAKFDHSDRFPKVTVDETLGYSGFRLRTELTEPGKKNEFCVFQGASYFRAIGYDQIYGLSARGLALRTGDPSGEEFPDFTRFWLERPAPRANSITLHALLDSPSVAGAYRFEITPGPACEMNVSATLFPRVALDNVGLGPLTSMFLYDATDRARFDDFRPAVHDSDGLMIWNGAGERLWRPLANPRELQISSFLDDGPRGFGLMQRARKFSDYADLEAQYHRRPCLWVEPQGDWGKGAITLVEIPSDKEIYDNIVAFWRPRDPLPPRQPARFSYRLSWGQAAPVPPDLPRVLRTAMGATHPWAKEEPGRMATIDFEAHPLLASGPEGIDIHISSPHCATTPGVLQRNPETGGLRLAFIFRPGDRPLAELRAQLRRDGAPVSEVWLYRWTA